MSDQLSEAEKKAAAVANLTVVMREALTELSDGSVSFLSIRTGFVEKSLSVLGIQSNIVDTKIDYDTPKQYTSSKIADGTLFTITPEAAKALSEAGVRSTALDRYLPKQPAVSVSKVSNFPTRDEVAQTEGRSAEVPDWDR